MLHIRTDGNETIGTGHVMRCLEIAKAYQETNGPVQFLVADERSKKFIESKGFSCYLMESDWNNLDSELDKLCLCKTECGVVRLLVDSYYLSQEYVKAWKKLGVKVAYLDDLCSQSYPVDMLFNGAVWATGKKYQGLYQQTDTKLFLGCRYLPLRQEFSNIPSRQFKEKAENVLVLSGGTDPYHFLVEFLKNLPEDLEKECQYYIVCGIFNGDYDEIVNLCHGKDSIHVLRNADNLYEYMCKADIAISACGMTLYELCACRTPAIIYLLADNQKGNLDGFTQKKIYDSIGDIREHKDFKLLFDKLAYLISNYEKRNEMSRKVQEMVDGRGAYRIAEELGRM